MRNYFSILVLYSEIILVSRQKKNKLQSCQGVRTSAHLVEQEAFLFCVMLSPVIQARRHLFTYGPCQKVRYQIWYVQAKTLSWIIDKERYVKVYKPSKHDSRKDLANLRIHSYLFSIDLVEMYKGCRHDTQIIIFNFLYKLNFKIACKK